jgi:cytochrome b561
LLVLVAHVGAALKHHLSDNDNVLRRMLPFARLRNGSTSEGERP